MTNEEFEQVMKEIYYIVWPEGNWDSEEDMEDSYWAGLKEWESGEDEADEWWNQEESF